MSDLTTTTIGLSKSAHDKLKQLVEDGYFGQLIDCYRFAIGLGLSHGMKSDVINSRVTIFNIGTLDPDKSIFFAIKTLYESNEDFIYKTAERLAEWGVEEMYRSAQMNKLSIIELLEEASSLEQH